MEGPQRSSSAPLGLGNDGVPMAPFPPQASSTKNQRPGLYNLHGSSQRQTLQVCTGPRKERSPQLRGKVGKGSPEHPALSSPSLNLATPRTAIGLSAWPSMDKQTVWG